MMFQFFREGVKRFVLNPLFQSSAFRLRYGESEATEVYEDSYDPLTVESLEQRVMLDAGGLSEDILSADILLGTRPAVAEVSSIPSRYSLSSQPLLLNTLLEQLATRAPNAERSPPHQAQTFSPLSSLFSSFGGLEEFISEGDPTHAPIAQEKSTSAISAEKRVETLLKYDLTIELLKLKLTNWVPEKHLLENIEQLQENIKKIDEGRHPVHSDSSSLKEHLRFVQGRIEASRSELIQSIELLENERKSLVHAIGKAGPNEKIVLYRNKILGKGWVTESDRVILESLTDSSLFDLGFRHGVFFKKNLQEGDSSIEAGIRTVGLGIADFTGIIGVVEGWNGKDYVFETEIGTTERVLKVTAGVISVGFLLKAGVPRLKNFASQLTKDTTLRWGQITTPSGQKITVLTVSDPAVAVARGSPLVVAISAQEAAALTNSALLMSASNNIPDGEAPNRVVTNAGQELRDLTIKGWRKGKGAPHFTKHGQGMGFNSLNEYTEAAKQFQKMGGHVTESKVGNLLYKYDHASERILVVSSKERTIVTFYKADNGIRSLQEAMRKHWETLLKQGH